MPPPASCCTGAAPKRWAALWGSLTLLHMWELDDAACSLGTLLVCLQEAASCIVTKRVRLMILVGAKWLAASLAFTWIPLSGKLHHEAQWDFHSSSGLNHLTKFGSHSRLAAPWHACCTPCL